MRTAIRAACAVTILASATTVMAATDWSQVDEALGLKGSMQAGGVYKFGFPRRDLDVTLDGVRLEPAFALGSWLAFKEVGGHAVVMGDLVLLEDEVPEVMSRLAEGDIDVTALHNHLLRAQPFPMYMHVSGEGDAVLLAKTLRGALEASKTPLSAAGGGAAPRSSAAGAAGTAGPLDTAALDRVMGRTGSANGNLYHFGIPRAETIEVHGMSVPPPMGTAIAINFEPTAGGKAATTGDFVLRAEEVNPVLRALKRNGIEVTALHNHMLGEEPRLYFMHFWGHDDAEKLARGLQAALAEVDVAN